jgi:hypothetical protein
MPMLPAPPVMTATFPVRSKSSEAFIGHVPSAALDGYQFVVEYRGCK